MINKQLKKEAIDKILNINEFTNELQDKMYDMRNPSSNPNLKKN